MTEPLAGELSRARKLIEEDARKQAQPDGPAGLRAAEKRVGPVRIRPVETYNDYVLVLQAEIETSIAMPAKASRKPEGHVVGIPAEGNGLPDGAGGRLKSQFKIGDYVVFYPKIVQEISPQNGPYKGKSVVVLSEKSILFKAPPVPFEIIQAGEADATL